MGELRKLELKDKDKLEELIIRISIEIENEYFWLPINNESREHFFDKKWTYFLGMFEEDELIAAVGLFFNRNEYEESEKILEIENYNNAEIGRAMVLSKYRHNGLMKKITKELITYAKEHEIQYLIATAHPENMPSKKSLEAVGMVKKAHCLKLKKYERDIYLLKCGENQ